MIILPILAVALVLVGAPVAFVLGLVGTIAFVVDGTSLVVVAQQSFQGLYNFILLAIPFFVLTGSIMELGGVSTRITNFASVLVGWMRGGLGMVDIVASMIFADISGSATADTAAIGAVMIPGLIKRGYKPEIATALQSAAGSLGLLFPPAVGMIVYCYVANTSVAKMFTAAFVPGFMVAVSFMVINYILALWHGYPAERFPTFGQVASSTWQAAPALLAPAIILGGILAGIFTPTEAGAVAAIYVLLLTTFAYKTMTWSKMWLAVRRTVSTTARVMFLLSMALLLGLYFIRVELPQAIARDVLPVSANPLILLLIINVVLLVMHTCLETMAAIIVLVPVLLPLLAEAGIDPVHFGIVLLINSAIGINLPPIGFCLYISCSITGVPIEKAAIAILPFVGALLVDLVLVSVFPDLALFLPRVLGM